jgi:hypothetical protein
MRHVGTSIRWLAGLCGPALALGVLAGSAAIAPPPAPLAAQPAFQCTWRQLPGAMPVPVFHHAGAFDTKNNVFYAYGGLDRSQDVVNTIQKLDVSAPDLANARQSRVPAGGAKQRYGAAGAYRPNPDPAGGEGKIYWTGGADDDGEGNTDIQVFDVQTGSITSQTPSGGLQRLFHAAAYDPGHDVIVVHGGTKKCELVRRGQATPTPMSGDVAAPGQAEECQGDRLPTQFLRFDPMTGTPSWLGGPSGGPNQVFGLSMVYDSTAMRMLAFGGITRESGNPSRELWALSLADPSLANAAWTRLSVGGGPSARLFHAAAYDPVRNWMVIYGGITSDPFQPPAAGSAGAENVSDETWALDLGANPPGWTKLGTSVQERAAAVADFAPNHQAALLVGGRRQIRFRIPPSQNVVSEAHALVCTVLPGVTITPTTGATATPTVTGTIQVPTPTRTPVPPVSPTSTLPPGTAVPTMPPVAEAEVCDFIQNRVPAAVINAALANPSSIQGWDQRCYPSRPEGPGNGRRHQLSLKNIALPYHAVFNSLTFKCGCP